MAVAAITVSGVTRTNDQKTEIFFGTLKFGNIGDSYVPGGLAFDTVLTAALLPNSNQAPIYVVLNGSQIGYIYQRIPSTGKLMILLVPPTGSLTTQAPLQELNAGNTLSAVQADVVNFEARYLRNN